MSGARIRLAVPSDLDTIFDLIRGLAIYEKLEHECTGTKEQLFAHLFGARPYCEALIVESGEEAVGFARFFTNYSTFLCKPGLYLEDLFVKPEHRGRGYGKALMQALAKICIERDYGRFEWSVLDWNQPSIEFYESLGAVRKLDWQICRVTGEALQKLGADSSPAV